MLVYLAILSKQFIFKFADIFIHYKPVSNGALFYLKNCGVGKKKKVKRKLDSTSNNAMYLSSDNTKIFSRENKKLAKVNTTVRLRNIFWVLISPSLETPGGVLKLHLVPCCPFGIDGLLSDEAMAPASRVLVDPVHPALFDSVPLIVMVRDNTVIRSTVRGSKVS